MTKWSSTPVPNQHRALDVAVGALRSEHKQMRKRQREKRDYSDDGANVMTAFVDLIEHLERLRREL